LPRVPVRLPLILAFATAATAAALAVPEPQEESREQRFERAHGVFLQYCAGCHGEWGQGASASSLVDGEWIHGGGDEDIAASIRDGRPGTAMVGFGEILEEDQVPLLVWLLRTAERYVAESSRPLVEADGVVIESEKQTVRLEVVVRELFVPWALEFAPDGSLLVSDRHGELWVVEDGQRRDEPVKGTPTPWVRQDGGFLDIALHPEYAKNGWVYLAYSAPGPDNDVDSLRDPRNTSMTVILRGRIRGNEWTDEQVLFDAPDLYGPENLHYGSRFLFDGQGKLLYSIGDRGRKADAQDLSSPLGKVHRVNDDGTPAADNPFAGREDALPTIWSFGHRNPQGFARDPRTGDLWESEHGPIGGDELNVVEPGKNYGWPVISDGVEPGTTEKRREGMEPPIVSWSPAIAPSSLHFYTGDRYPGWKNSLFLATLAGRALRRFEVDGRQVTHEEVVFEEFGRVRDVTTGPDGLLYVALERRQGFETKEPLGLVMRLVPVEG
jgi:glucose/arabinose dehydrogenase